MSKFSLMRPALLGIVTASIMSSAFAQPYVHGMYGLGDESSSQWGGGVGVDFDNSPWGMELNGLHSGEVDLQNDSIEQQWIALSATLRSSDVWVDGMTIKGGIGLASLYQRTHRDDFNNNNYSWNVTPNIEVSYRLNQYWDVFGGYRFFLGDTFDDRFSPNAFTLGARLYWSRSAPVVTLLNDEAVTPSMEALRATTFAQSEAAEQIIDGYGLAPSVTQFVIQNDNPDIEWQEVVLTLDDDREFKAPLNADIARFEERLPKGEHELHFALIGQHRKTGERQEVEASQSMVLYHSQGVRFLLSVKSHILGDSLHVQAF